MSLNYDEWKYSLWKSNKKSWIHPLHSMCSYLAMFPPSIPNYFIKQFTHEGQVVFDPFSGRGTTALEACLNNRIGIGNDLNPLAQILTAAKVSVPDKKKLFKRVDILEENYTKPNCSGVDDNIKFLFNNDITLPQLLYLKNTLHQTNKSDIFLLGTILGIMHGRSRKDGTSMYLSISMPNTFSMAPNYLKSYISTNNLTCLEQDVFQCIRHKIDLIYKKPFNNYRQGKLYKLDAAKINYDKRVFNEKSVDLIITSPPYLKVINYGTYNWIRLWLLNKNIKAIDEKLRINKIHCLNKEYKLKDNLILKDYLEFMKNVICGWERILKDDGMAIVVIGDVSNYNGKYIRLGEEVWNYAKSFSSLKLVDIIEDKINNKTKVTKIWGNSKGNATKIDRILILTKGRLRTPNYTTNISNEFNYF